MSAWSTQRRVSIAITALVIFSFIISAILFVLFYNPETCRDGIQNGSEFGIDCGGVCPNICPIPPKDLLDIWTRAFKIADGVYSAVAYIENQNENLYVPSVQFEMVLYDSKNTPITRASQKASIIQNGITPIFVPHIITHKREAVRAVFRFTEEPKFVQREKKTAIDIKNISLIAPYDEAPSVSATATNIGTDTIAEADFVVVVYDEDGTAIGASRTFETYIEPNETRTLQYTWVHPFELHQGLCSNVLCEKQPKRVEIFPVVIR